MVSRIASRFEVERFNGKLNFGLWQKRVKAALVQQGLHKALLGKEKKPESMSIADWEDMDLRALSTIQLCLADEVMYNVLDEETATGLWSKLEKLYMTKSLTNKLYLKRQLYSLRMDAGGNLLDHLNNFNKLIADLLSVDVKVEEEDKALLLLSSLPESYDHLVTTVLYGRDTLNMEEVTTTLLSNNMRRKSTIAEDGEGLMAAGSVGGRRRFHDKGSNSEGSKHRPRIQKDQCAFCKEKGHWKRDCPKLQQVSYVDGRSAAEASRASIAEFDRASDEVLTVDEGTGTSSDLFLLDSGCSTHVCSRIDWFDTFQEGKTGVVSLGDGSICDVTGIGTVKIRTSDGTVRTLGDVAYVPKLRRNLISLGRLDSKGCRYSAAGGVICVRWGNLVLMRGRKMANQLYRLEGEVLKQGQPTTVKRVWKRVEKEVSCPSSLETSSAGKKKVSFAADWETMVADGERFQNLVAAGEEDCNRSSLHP